MPTRHRSAWWRRRLRSRAARIAAPVAIPVTLAVVLGVMIAVAGSSNATQINQLAQTNCAAPSRVGGDRERDGLGRSRVRPRPPTPWRSRPRAGWPRRGS